MPAGDLLLQRVQLRLLLFFLRQSRSVVVVQLSRLLLRLFQRFFRARLPHDDDDDDDDDDDTQKTTFLYEKKVGKKKKKKKKSYV